ncbi:MAG: hypothetical protein JW974_03530 [Alphaproteobacteria bacterium]|nr:hypothetical protein [Alphaproteobacteria bacterium]MBN2675310.1 hypothetical protein [Alphaproteobacteria bacterium]
MKTIKIKTIAAFIFSVLIIQSSFGASVVATIGGKPITDTDITARTKLMSKQGDVSTDNRRKAFQNIIDDYVKLEYAGNFNISTSKSDIDKELKSMKLGDISATELAMAKNAISANMAWQIVIARTIVPTIDVSNDEITQEKQDLERTRGLPLEMTIVRLIDVPDNISAKLINPKDCNDAIQQAKNLGGDPQKFTAAQYELSVDIREQIVGLDKLTWSKPINGSVLLVCDSRKTKDYGKLDDIIKQNAIYKKAMFKADQQLKQLRRKAVIVINDSNYKI